MSGTSTADIVVGTVLIINGLALTGFCGWQLWKLHKNERNHP